MQRYLGSYASQLYSIMRIVVGLLFALHGAQKLFGLFGGVGGAAAQVSSLLGIAGLIELFGGLLIAVGFLTGYIAFTASGEMAFAYFTQHFPKAFWPIENSGELAVLYCFVFLYMASVGSGALSIDAALGKGSRL